MRPREIPQDKISFTLFMAIKTRRPIRITEMTFSATYLSTVLGEMLRRRAVSRIEVACLEDSAPICEGLLCRAGATADFATEVYWHWPAREQFWLDKLGDVSEKAAVVFICGDGHVDSFQSLLKQYGIESSVIKRGIGLTDYDVEFSKKLQLYIKAHPERFK